MELIKITEYNGKQAVSGRELHSFLESKQDFSNWIKNRIEKYGFIENQDFQRFDKIIETGGRLIEYALSVDCAKEISMVEGSQKGKLARQYFIECEKRLKNPAAELSRIDLARMVIAAEEEKVRLQLENDRLNMRTQFVDAVFMSDKNLTLSEAAKLLKLPFGRNIMTKKLREMGVFFKTGTEPMQAYVDRGYFKVFEVFNESLGQPFTQTYVTQKGLGWLAKQFNVVITEKKQILIN